jgi:hypothetical protein
MRLVGAPTPLGPVCVLVRCPVCVGAGFPVRPVLRWAGVVRVDEPRGAA